MQLMNDQQLVTLIRSSLRTSQYEAGIHREDFLRLYLELLYKECNLPLPGVVLDLLGSIGLNMTSNRTLLDFEESINYRNFFLLSFQHSGECKRIRELIPLDQKYFWSFCKRFLEIFFDRIELLGVALNAVQVRDLLPQLISTEEDELIASFVSEDINWMKLLDRSDLTRKFQICKPVFQEEDYWDLAQIKSIQSDSLRYALRECHKWRNWLMDRSNYFISRVRKEIEYSLADQNKNTGNYPVGGISELSNRGSLENLLRSELVYSELDEEINLFEVRYVEGELLYYQRDSNQIEQLEQEVDLYLHNKEFYPYVNGSRVHPFFVYAILLFWVEHASKIHPGFRFKFHLHVLETDVRDSEFIKVLRSFGVALIKMDRLNLIVEEQFGSHISIPGHRELHVGAIVSGRYCVDWYDNGFSIQSPRSVNGRMAQTYNFDFSEESILDVISLGLKSIFEKSTLLNQ